MPASEDANAEAFVAESPCKLLKQPKLIYRPIYMYIDIYITLNHEKYITRLQINFQVRFFDFVFNVSSSGLEHRSCL